MRKSHLYGMPKADAVALLARARLVRLAGINKAGAPVLRTLHPVVLEESLFFHSAPVGEKSELLGTDVVIAAEEVVAEIPSYVFDPERACPATTYYRSAQCHGRLEDVASASTKGEVLQTLMQKFQPEGGHVPVDAESALYRRGLEGLSVMRVRLEHVEGKSKLGQNRSAEDIDKLVEFLWARGGPGDLSAISQVIAAHPERPVPKIFSLGGGRTIELLGRESLADAVALVRSEYWNEGVPLEAIEEAHLASNAWVGVRDDGRLVATARAVSDSTKNAWIYDVAVAPPLRKNGLGTKLVRFLLDHPALRRARQIWLGTKDGMPFYEKLGFERRATHRRAAYEVSLMSLSR